MDNHFVPNLTIGLPVVEQLSAPQRPCRWIAHLMIEDPDRWAPGYARPAREVTFHVEAAAAPIRLAREIRTAGARAGPRCDRRPRWSRTPRLFPGNRHGPDHVSNLDSGGKRSSTS